ncbi:hypothetical protein O181_046088 [Austropuccinia psidii MF-1]|uniref:Reverse transcriptase domain-containing protein n=1 Tax=Austropuccinia psidii MF-1 TaxID=1389203 RepID=A0A9Q3DRK5_9BASI|nr:hypothetical protein [Austropuccinia psidii MF-1]
MSELPEKIPIIILDSSESPSLFVTHHTKYMVELTSFPSIEWDCLVIDTPKGEDLILGYDFVNHFNPSIDWRQGLITFNSDNKDYYDPSKCFSNDFSSAKSCAALVDEVFKEIQDVGEDSSVSSLHLFFGSMDLPPSSYYDSLEELWDEEEEPEEVETVMKVVPYVYHKYLDVLSKVKAEKIFPHCACDHHVKLEGSLPPVGVIYSLSNQESDTRRAYISENVEKGFIWSSSSLKGAPVLFDRKKDGGLRLCVDYSKLNAVTRKNKYPVPPMNQLLNVFNGSSIFSKIDLCGSYKLLRVREGDEHLTAFRNKYGKYKYFITPFGLTNAPASFQNLVNDIFQDLLDVFVVAYLDDIMVFSKCEEEHVTHVATVLTRLRANNLFAKASKCLLHVTSVEYLETDASNYSLGDVLSQVSYSEKHPIAFDINKYIPEELNYEINDKELLGIVWALKCWRAFLLSLYLSFEVLTNHFLLQYFISSKVLTHHQARWDEFLSEFHLSITYHLALLATLPDALSHWGNLYPERGEDFISKNPMNLQQLITQDEVQPSRYFAVKVEFF